MRAIKFFGILLWLLPITAQAQSINWSETKGYLGKRFIVHMHLTTAPNFNGKLMPRFSGMADRSNFVTPFSFNSSAGLGLTYSILSKLAIRIDHSVKLKKLYFPAAYTEFYSDFGYIWQNFYYVDPRNPFLTSQINKTSIALQYYKGQRIAPVGRYFELGFNFLTAQVLSNQEFIQNYNWNGSLYAANSQSIQIDKKKTKQKMRSIFFGIGRGKVLKHGMYFSTAVRFHFPFISFSDGDIDLPLKNYNGEEADKLVLDGNQTQVGFTRMDESILEPGEPGEEGYYYIRSRLYHYLFANEMFEIRFSIGKVF